MTMLIKSLAAAAAGAALGTGALAHEATPSAKEIRGASPYVAIDNEPAPKLIVDPPWEAEYDLGYYRPGDRIPEDSVYWPFHGIGPPLRGMKY